MDAASGRSFSDCVWTGLRQSRTMQLTSSRGLSGVARPGISPLALDGPCDPLPSRAKGPWENRIASRESFATDLDLCDARVDPAASVRIVDACSAIETVGAVPSLQHVIAGQSL